jgi:hypothetical protein
VFRRTKTAKKNNNVDSFGTISSHRLCNGEIRAPLHIYVCLRSTVSLSSPAKCPNGCRIRRLHDRKQTHHFFFFIKSRSPYRPTEHDDHSTVTVARVEKILFVSNFHSLDNLTPSTPESDWVVNFYLEEKNHPLRYTETIKTILKKNVCYQIKLLYIVLRIWTLNNIIKNQKTVLV